MHKPNTWNEQGNTSNHLQKTDKKYAYPPNFIVSYSYIYAPGMGNRSTSWKISSKKILVQKKNWHTEITKIIFIYMIRDFY